MRLIESLYDNREYLDAEGYPCPSLLEDPDGMRAALVPDLADVSDHLWAQLHSAGARYLIDRHDGQWRAIFVDRFMELVDARRQKREKAVRGVTTGWHVFTDCPTYRQIYLRSKPGRETGFVHLHAHSEFSLLDGLSTVSEMVGAAVDDGQPAIAVTDHGVCASHPTLQKQAKAGGIKPIFGIEANLVEDRHNQTPEVLHDYRHLVMWAKDLEGLQNIWAMSTEAYRTGFYGRPRMDWEVLGRHSKGVMASTGCLRGPLAWHILADEEDRTLQTLSKLMDLFGDNLYLELQTYDDPEQELVNYTLLDLAQTYSLPTIVAVDSHYVTEADQATHQVWIASQTNKTLLEETKLFAKGNFHLMTSEEVRKALAYLPEDAVDQAMQGTLAVADRCDVVIEGKSTPPVFSKEPTEQESVRRDVDRLLKLCIDNWDKCLMDTYGFEVYEARFEREMRLLIDKGFCGYFLMVADYCQWARKHGILVGPGRGSGSGSLVAFLAGITGIDPVETGLMFERFLTEGRMALPDFDVDFPASHRQEIADYLARRYSEENVVRVGTQIRLKNKGIVRNLARTLKGTVDIHYPDVDAISRIIDEAEADKTGFGMPWEELWEENEEVLVPYRVKYPDLFHYAERMVGRVKSFGKHAAGVVIAPDIQLTDRLPMRRGGSKDPELVAEFDMDSLDELGFVKFDLLTLRTLDTIQMTIDMVRDQEGDEIDLASWRDEYHDEMVWDELSEGHTLGVFQIETPGGTRFTKQLKPHSLDELADLITLVRPGPVRSGLTATYFKRREGQEVVSVIDQRLAPILANTYGCMIYQEQVIQICMELGGYTETEADDVRKILGKKQMEKVEEAGKQFIERAVGTGTERPVAEVLWSQMAEFARYGFNRSHAYGYATLGFWCAWLKFHYPSQFLAAAMSTVDKGRIPQFINEARRMGFRVLPPDINISGKGFTSGATDIRYGFDGVKGIGGAAVDAIMEGQPYYSFDDFMETKGKKANLGVVKTLARVGAFDSLVPNRQALEEEIRWQFEGGADWCVHKDESVLGPNGLPCMFDWSSEPVTIGASGKPLKPKPIPKRCVRSCRNFTAPSKPDFSGPGYTPDEIMAREVEMLGMFLSYSPFDRIPEEVFTEEMEGGGFVVKGTAVETGEIGYEFVTVGLINRVKPHIAKNGKSMGFMSLNAVDAVLDIVVFSDEWTRHYRDLRVGNMCFVYLRKNDRGLALKALQVT